MPRSGPDRFLPAAARPQGRRTLALHVLPWIGDVAR